MASLEEQIIAVEEKIVAVEEQIKTCTNVKERLHLRKKEEQLRKKEEQLREEMLLQIKAQQTDSPGKLIVCSAPSSCLLVSSFLGVLAFLIVTAYSCIIRNGRKRKCFRARVFALGECHLAHVREGESNDGICQDDDNLNNLKILLLFEEKRDALHFQSSLNGYVTSVLRKRDNELDSAHDIRVDNELVSSTVLSGVVLTRVMQRQYAHDYDATVTVNSPDCDSINDSTSIYAGSVLDVDISPEVVLQMVENPQSVFFFGKPAEISHLKSRTKFPDSASNINNRLYLSRYKYCLDAYFSI